jgi:hypothetical protein
VVLEPVLTVSVEELDVGLGEKEAEVRDGTPLTLKLTEPVKPFCGLTVTAYVMRPPRVTVWVEGNALREKLGEGGGGGGGEPASAR